MPRVKTFVGSNLIATGHSGVDNFLAYASLSCARLSIYTGDPHFADVARLLQHNSGQFVDVAGSLGYAIPELTTEAFTLAVNRGTSVRAWLPWCTSAIVEPMARMREAFEHLQDAIVGNVVEQVERGPETIFRIELHRVERRQEVRWLARLVCIAAS